MSLSRVVVVDDFEGWRRTICSILEAAPELRVIGEAADGEEAVQKAEELKPDLITLDVGLPKLNGIEAAARMSKISPRSKIVFVSQHTDADVLRAALSTGASGYVHKANANTELLPAVAAVLRGDNFLSSEMGWKNLDEEGLSLTGSTASVAGVCY
jgi:DNA-binding NarL/FixJ family response regulator